MAEAFRKGPAALESNGFEAGHAVSREEADRRAVLRAPCNMKRSKASVRRCSSTVDMFPVGTHPEILDPVDAVTDDLHEAQRRSEPSAAGTGPAHCRHVPGLLPATRQPPPGCSDTPLISPLSRTSNASPAQRGGERPGAVAGSPAYKPRQCRTVSSTRRSTAPLTAPAGAEGKRFGSSDRI